MKNILEKNVGIIYGIFVNIPIFFLLN